MTEDKAGVYVEISVAEIAVIIVETLSGQPRPDDVESKQLMEDMLGNPPTTGLGCSALNAAHRIVRYLKTSVEAAQALQKIGFK